MAERLDSETVRKEIAEDYSNFNTDLNFDSFIRKLCLNSYNLTVFIVSASDYFSFNLNALYAPFAAFRCND